MATHAIKTKLSTSTFKAKTKSAYAIYLDGLAPTGRKSMRTLLQQCAAILGHEKPIERFDWNTLTFEKVHLIRSVFTEAGYAVSSINLALAEVIAGLKEWKQYRHDNSGALFCKIIKGGKEIIAKRLRLHAHLIASIVRCREIYTARFAQNVHYSVA